MRGRLARGSAGAGVAARRGARLLVVLAVLAVAGCTAGPSIRPPIAIRGADPGTPGQTQPSGQPTPLPPLDQPVSPTITWTDCTGSTAGALNITVPAGLTFGCSKISAVLDPPGLPGRGTVRLAALKAGTGPIPLAVVNDTAGEPSTLFTARLATRLPADFLRTFSLVAVDRRGTGASSPTNCVPDRQRQAITAFDPSAATKDQLTQYLDSVRGATQECSMALDKRAVAYDSWRSASDLDTLRTGLGMAHLNAIGRGTGSLTLTAFRARFPDRVGRMVLDGAPDPKLDDIAQYEVIATGAQDTLTAFAATCAVRPGCPLGTDPMHALPALAQQLTDQPAHTGAGQPVGGGVLYEAVRTALADPAQWPTLVDALVKVRAGDGNGIAGLAAPVTTGAPGTDQLSQPPRFDAQLTSQCNDTTTRVPLERILTLAPDWKTKFPAFGAYFAHQLLICAPWPSAAKALPLPTAAGPPALVLATATDPVTPLTSTKRMAEQLAATTVQWQGIGHGALPGSQCATAAVQHYLVDGKVPSADQICPP